VGRRPGLELSFDPERDPGVSGIHAELVESAGAWVVRDLASRNGTFINGVPVVAGPEGGATLRDGDRITFGAGGPEVEVALTGNTLSRIRAEAGRQTRFLRLAVILLGVALGSALIAFVALHQIRESGFQEERARLLADTEEALAEIAMLSAARGGEPEGAVPRDAAGSDAAGSDAAGSPDPRTPGDRVPELHVEVAALTEALRRSEAELQEIREALRRAPESGSSVRDEGEVTEGLRRQLQAATAALRRQQLAGSLDLDAVQRGNRQAVALVFVEAMSGEVATGTAFAVRPDGTLLTVRHLVRPEAESALPRRIAVQFSDSDQVWPARLLAVSEEVDLAALRVENIAGVVPVVRGINTRPDTLGTGVAVGSLGFPLGGSAEAGSGVARPLVTAGVLSTLRPTELEVFGYGDVGASGSPVFDGAGEVVGILFGGRTEGLERILLAVNGVQAVRFLGRVP
jgi:S1-C subfamily serine protease